MVKSNGSWSIPGTGRPSGGKPASGRRRVGRDPRPGLLAPDPWSAPRRFPMRTLPVALTVVFLASSGARWVRADEPPTPVPAPAKEAAPADDILRWIADL